MFCENRKYLKSITDTSVITCDEITSVMDIVITKMTNAIATNVTKRDCYILHEGFLAIILLLIIIIICYHYAKY